MKAAVIGKGCYHHLRYESGGYNNHENTTGYRTGSA